MNNSDERDYDEEQANAALLHDDDQPAGDDATSYVGHRFADAEYPGRTRRPRSKPQDEGPWVVVSATLHFDPSGTMPGPEDATYAASWAAQRHHYGVAAALAGLAHALEVERLERGQRRALVELVDVTSDPSSPIRDVLPGMRTRTPQATRPTARVTAYRCAVCGEQRTTANSMALHAEEAHGVAGDQITHE